VRVVVKMLEASGLLAALRLLLSKLLLQLFAALGPGLGALLALLIEKLFSSEQLDESLLCAVAALESSADNAQVAAIAIAVAGRDSVKQPGDCLAGLQEGQSLTARMKVALLTERDEFFDVRARGLGLGDGSLDAVLQDDRRDQVAQQSAAMAGVSSQFESCIAMTHGVSLYLKI